MSPDRPRRAALAVLALLLVGCGRTPEQPAGPAAGGGLFSEVARESGIAFDHRSGATGKFLLPEIMGGGAGFLDYDGDGLLDVYLVQSGKLGAPDDAVANRLYRNEGSGRFAEVTDAAGVADPGYGMGCAAGDFDNDSDVDLYVTNLGPNVLYRNEGDGTFTDVTETAGVGGPGWTTSAAFVDYDGDGDLDLFATNYVGWSDAPAFTSKRCFATTGARDYCAPGSYDAPSFDSLYRNEGDGTFTDVSLESGIHSRAGTGLGVLCADLDGDSRVDIYVANDQMPSFAWINLGQGRFAERAVELGIAVDEAGNSQAGMGVASMDVDADGDLDLWKVHLHRESHILYLNQGGFFDDATSRLGLAAPTRGPTGFGTGFLDVHLDGRQDIFVADGRVQYVVDSSDAEDVYAEPNQLLMQTEEGGFVEHRPAPGSALALTENSRAAAFGDYDNDGDLDVLVANRDGAARLLRNDAPREGSFVTLRLVDRHGRDAYGTRVTTVVGGRSQVRLAHAAYSYCATNDPRVHVGLGRHEAVERVDVRWPDGSTGTYGPFQAGRFVEIAQSARESGDANSHVEHDPEREDTFRSHRAEFQAIADELARGTNQYFGHAQIEALKRQVTAPDVEPKLRIRARVLLTLELLRIGDVDGAVESVEAALAEAKADDMPAGLLPGIHRVRGLAYLRKAEVQNCIARHNADCCIFPLRGGGVHEQAQPARRAKESYLYMLKHSPEDLKLRWLLNLVAMALAEYPGGVPEEYRIAPEAFASDADPGRFTDVAPKLGVDSFNLCGGCIVDDFDLDGRLDIVTSTSDPAGPVAFYRNTGRGKFEDRSAASRIDDQLGGLNSQGADYDNDGDVDVLILRGAWLFDEGRIRNSLRAQQRGRHVHRRDRTRRAWPLRPYPTQAAAWGDFDNDGDLDLYVGNESARGVRPVGRRRLPLAAVRQRRRRHVRGRGRRECRCDERPLLQGRRRGGLRQRRRPRPVRLERTGPNRLYRNDGRRGVHRRRRRGGVSEPEGRSFADLVLRLRQRRLARSVRRPLRRQGFEDVAADFLGLPQPATPPSLYRNNGDGRFDRRDAESAGTGPCLLADGGQLRRPGQRRVARHLSGDRRPGLPDADAQRDAAQRSRPALPGRDHRGRIRPPAERPRGRVRRPGQRRRPGSLPSARRLLSRRQVRQRAVPQPRPRQSLPGARAGGPADQPGGLRGAGHGDGLDFGGATPHPPCGGLGQQLRRLSPATGDRTRKGHGNRRDRSALAGLGNPADSRRNSGRRGDPGQGGRARISGVALPRRPPVGKPPRP